MKKRLQLVLSLLRTFVRNFFTILKLRYGFKNNLKLFAVLNYLYVKSKISSGSNNAITISLLHFKISALNYGVLYYLIKEIFISEIYFFESQKKEPVIIDCGSNIGMAVLYFKYLYPECHIKAFEANPYAFEMLKKNVSQNNFENVEIINAALCNNEGIVDFFTGDKNDSLLGSLYKERSDKHVLQVQTARLSQYIPDDQPIDLIKIDIEGAESEVIQDLAASNKLGNPARYLIEYHHRIGKQKSALSYFLRPFEEVGFEYSIRARPDLKRDFQDVFLDFSRKVT